MRKVLAGALAIGLAAGLWACGVVTEEAEPTETRPDLDGFIASQLETTTGSTTWPGLTAADSFMSWDHRQPLLIAMDEANGLYLYGLPGGAGGVVLIYNDENHYLAPYRRNSVSACFDWQFVTGRQFMPEITMMEFDSKQKIVAKAYSGSGTGISYYYLYVVNPETMNYSHFAPEDIRAQLEQAILFSYDAENDQITIGDGRNEIVSDVEFDVNELWADRLNLTAIVDFNFDEQGIELVASVGFPAVFAYHCEVTARVNYSNGTFTLSDIAIREFPPRN